MEATCEALSSVEELTVAAVVEQFVQDGPQGEVGRLIIKYQAKEKALQDVVLALRDN